jgi:hypothetical protein
MLYVMADRSPTAQNYRDVFERIKMNIYDAIEGDSSQTSRETGVLDEQTAGRCRTLNDGLLDTVKTDYEQIITDLAKDTEKITLDEQATPPELSFYMHGEPQIPTGFTPPQHWNMDSEVGTDSGIVRLFDTPLDGAFAFNVEDFDHLITW